LPFADGLGCKRRPASLTVGFARIAPVVFPWSPLVAETVNVGVAVLSDNCRHSLRMTHCKPQACRGSIIKDVKGILFQRESLSKPLNDISKGIKGIGKVTSFGSICLPEPRQVGRDQPV